MFSIRESLMVQAGATALRRMRSQWAARLVLMAALAALAAGSLTRTTMSRPWSRIASWRKLSRTRRRMRLRATAVRTRFADAVMPRRECSRPEGRYNTVNSRSAERRPCLKTASKSAARVSRRRIGKPCGRRCVCAPAAGPGNQGIRRARPLARRRLSTRRPPRVAMRARNP